MSLYLDASVLIPIFIAEVRSHDALTGILGQVLIVSDLAVTEFSAGVARRQRIGDISAVDAVALFAGFDAWIAQATQRATIETGDLLVATGYVRRLDLELRMPDAANLAIAQRLGATVFSFDQTMVAAAVAVGLDVKS